KKCLARDSAYFMNQTQNLVAQIARRERQVIFCVPFAPGSPFEPHIDRLGFVNAGSVTLTFKKVR
ncbi:MAG TPA: hypothetical protein VGR76_10560, partial [Candidatus Angelobacter sp.]|nr:hypothetical protein [Candidatus Angelobacter sp.]